MKSQKKKSKIIPLLIVIFIFVILGLSSFVLYNVFFKQKSIVLNGDDTIVLKLGEKYTELGIKGKDDVKISGEVDIDKVGEYKITYKTKSSSTTRTVKVIDDVKPEISYDGSSEIYLYKGNTYVDDKIYVSDNYDKDLDDKIVVENNVDSNKVGDYKIIYKVTDSSGNIASAERTIHVIDENVSMNKIPVLMYHFFYDESQGEKPRDNNFIEVKKFEEQIKYLSDNNYYYPTWNEIEMYLDKKIKLPEKSIVITVDDGDPSFFKYGTKILEKYNVKATSFIITAWYNPDYYEYNKKLLYVESHSNDMHRSGCNLGHGGIILCTAHDKGVKDLKDSVAVVRSSMTFCYPFGDYNDAAISMVKEVGFHMAVTTVEGKIAPGMNKYTLPRVRVSGTESMNYFIRSIN